MRWIVLAELPPEELKSDSRGHWALAATLYEINNDDDSKETLWVANLLHRHPDNPGSLHRCVLNNREDVENNVAFPLYRCGICGKKVPFLFVKEKIDKQKALVGFDPRNNRRGAVLATRNSNLKGTKEPVNG